MDSLRAKQNLHVVIRAGSSDDKFYPRIKGDIIEEHNAIVAKKGRALLGKLGQKPLREKLDLLDDSIATYHNAKLFVARKTKQGYIAFAAPIKAAHSEDSFVPQLSLVPSYYHHVVPEIKLWFEIGRLDKVDERRFQSLILLSSGKPLTEILSICRTPLMFVLEEKT